MKQKQQPYLNSSSIQERQARKTFDRKYLVIREIMIYDLTDSSSIFLASLAAAASFSLASLR